MQKIVALSVIMTQLSTEVEGIQDIMFVYHMISSLRLRVRLPMKLEPDKSGSVDN